MRAMRAEGFNGYQDLKPTDIASPSLSEGRALVRMTAAGVAPLDHTILSGQFPMAKAPLVLGNEGAGVVEAGGTPEYPKGSRVMFTGPYGVFEKGTLSELVAIQTEHLSLVPDNINDTAAAGLPVAYLTAFLVLKAAGFEAGKTVLAPAIGGSVGNAATQLARALGAKHAISTTTSHAKAEEAKKRGFSEVIDLSEERLAEGVRRLTDGYGADIVVDGVGGQILSEALEILAPDGSLTTLGYAASRKTTIDVTNLIWKGASIKSFMLFSQPLSARSDAWKTISELLGSGRVEPIVAKTFPLEDAASALRYLIEGRPSAASSSRSEPVTGTIGGPLDQIAARLKVVLRSSRGSGHHQRCVSLRTRITELFGIKHPIIQAGSCGMVVAGLTRDISTCKQLTDGIMKGAEEIISRRLGALLAA